MEISAYCETFMIVVMVELHSLKDKIVGGYKASSSISQAPK